jgi:hypothetical protein
MGVNYLWGNGKQAAHIAQTIKRCQEREYVAIEPTAEAEDEWRAALDDSHSDAHNPVYADLLRNLAECTPGYYNNDGDGDDRKGIFHNFYGFGILAYTQALEDWRNGDVEMAGMTLTR